MPARAAYWDRNTSVVCRRRAAWRASYSSRDCRPMIRGSFFALVHCGRNGHGVQSAREKRASKITPFFGYVLGNHEMLCLPAGHVTTCRSPSTTKLPLSKTRVGTGLPTGIVGDRTDDGHAVIAPA